ncbi:MAG TPA: hypothetical protein VF905_05955, partial [Nitrospirota bacterium]
MKKLVQGLLREPQQLIESLIMVTIMSWTSIGKVRRRRAPVTKGKPLSRLWDDLRIMPIWSDAVATYLCHPGRVSVLSRHAAFQLI